MNKHLSLFSIIGGGLILLLGIGFWYQVTHGAVVWQAQQAPLPTPVGSTPIPTAAHDNLPYERAGEPRNGLLVTPQPDEQVQVGAVQAITPTMSPTVEPSVVRRVEHTNGSMLLVESPHRGDPIELGNDQGETKRWLTTETEDYLFWSYFPCTGCAATELQSGLYAYIWEDGTNITITLNDNNAQWYPEIDGDWLVYVVFQTFTTPSKAHLHAYNFSTGEDVLLGGIVLPGGIRPEELYDIHENKITWLGTSADDLDASMRSFYVYDIATGTTTQLTPPPGTDFRLGVSFSDGILVWHEQKSPTWWGYDTTQDAVFTIPLVPPGWASVPALVEEPVKVRDGHLYWALLSNDEVHHFTAPIVRNEQ